MLDFSRRKIDVLLMPSPAVAPRQIGLVEPARATATAIGRARPRAAAEIGAYLARHGLVPDRVLCSTRCGRGKPST